MIKINSVRYSEPNGKVEIDYLEFNRALSTWDKKTLASEESPAPAFVEAMQDMTRVSIILCELPEEWAASMKTVGFVITDPESSRCLVIHSCRNLKSGEQVFFDSPSRDIDDITDLENPAMNEVIRYVDAAVQAAKDYVEGCRFHAKLPDVDDDRIIDEGGNIAFTAKGLGFQAGLDGKRSGANPYDMCGKQNAFIAWENGRQEGEKIRMYFRSQE